MDCERWSIDWEGNIFCQKRGSNIGNMVGTVQQPPTDITEEDKAAMLFWDEVATAAESIHPDIAVSLSVHEGNPTANITVKFSIEKGSAYVDRLDQAIKEFTADLNMLGCETDMWRSEHNVPSGSWWQVWGKKRLFWQVTVVDNPEEWATGGGLVCLNHMGNALRETKLSEFVMPPGRAFQDYAE